MVRTRHALRLHGGDDSLNHARPSASRLHRERRGLAEEHRREHREVDVAPANDLKREELRDALGTLERENREFVRRERPGAKLEGGRLLPEGRERRAEVEVVDASALEVHRPPPTTDRGPGMTRASRETTSTT